MAANEKMDWCRYCAFWSIAVHPDRSRISRPIVVGMGSRRG